MSRSVRSASTSDSSRRVELAELLVAGEHVGEAPRHRRAVAGKQHPEILHRRPHARVVEVDEVRAVVSPQDVPGVAVAVQPDRAHVAGALVAAAHAVERVVDHALPAGRSSGGTKPCSSSQSRGSPPKLAMSSAGRAANGATAPTAWMRPMKRPSHSSVSGIVELRRAAAAARIHREAEAAELVQRLARRSRAARPPGSRARRARARRRAPRGSARRSSAPDDRTWRPRAARPRRRPGRRGSRSCSARAGGRRRARRRTRARRAPRRA